MAKSKNTAVIDTTCKQCGGSHFGSFGCPFAETICDQCHKPLLQHEGFAFCDGGKTEHDPQNKHCTCEPCVAANLAFSKSIRELKEGNLGRVTSTPEGSK